MARITTPRGLASVALVCALLVSTGCGGGGGDGDNGQQVAASLDIVSTPTLDGVVFGDNASTQSRSDVQPAVGDGIPVTGQGASRFVAYYSFDLSQVPAGATITSATLSLFLRDTAGDPQGAMILIRLDHVRFDDVFPTTLLGTQVLDANFTVIDDMTVLGRKNLDIAVEVQNDLAAGRTRTQVGLRGAIASDFDNVADVALFTDGEDSFGTGELPLLSLEFDLP